MRYKEFRNIVRKGADENYFIDKYLFRYISILGSYVLSFTGISPNVVTLLSLIASLASVWFFMQTSSVLLIIGCALVFVYHYLDHVDGELSRFYAATKGRRAGISGSYFDLLCHSFSVNIWLPAIAFGVYVETGQPLVMVLGFAGMLVMSAFATHVGSYAYTIQLRKEPTLPADAGGKNALDVLVGRPRQIAAVRSGISSRTGLVKVAKEIIGYPGMILVIIACVIFDALTGLIWARIAIIAVLVLFHGANNIRRGMSIAKSFRRVG